MIRAIIFDMDGLLIDSEPFWQQAEIETFQKVNIHLTRELCMETMGLRIDEVVSHWHKKHPWDNISQKEIQDEIVQSVIRHITEQAGAMTGVYEILEYFKSKDLPIALASSSYFSIIHSVIKKLNIKEYFKVIRSGELEEYGKPHPGIFINTAKELNISPMECMVFEDSFNGLIAARSARMKSVAIPEPSHYLQTRFDIAHLKLRSLKEFSEDHLEMLHNITT